MSKSVTLWIPELLHVSRIEEAGESLKKTKLPWLSRLLSKSDSLPIKPNQSFYQTASYLFHQPTQLPIAATLSLAELTDVDEKPFWLKVDPVQLIADRDSLILVPAKDLGITEDESRALLEAFNVHFAEENVQLEYGCSTSWYLSIVQSVDIETVSIEDLTYKPLNDAMPKGNAATYWKKLINEAQMLFFAHPVNEARREKNLPEINSIWVWGEGMFDENKIKQREKSAIYSNNRYLKGMAQKTTNNQFFELNSTQGGSLKQVIESNNEHDFICLDNISDSLETLSEQEWLDCLVELDKTYFEPLYQQLKQGCIPSLLLDLGQKKRHHLEPKHLNRFWRFPKNITKF